MVFFGKEILYRIRIQNRAKVHNVNKVNRNHRMGCVGVICRAEEYYVG